MSNQSKKQESVKTLLYVIFIAVTLGLRNVFFPGEVVPRYSQIPYRWNSPIFRISSNYFSSAMDHEKNGTKKKSLHRNLFFNMIRNLLPDFCGQLLITGRLNAVRNVQTILLTIVVSLFFQYLPLKTFKKARYLWAWSMMEHYTKHAANLIDNRNTLEKLYG